MTRLTIYPAVDPQDLLWERTKFSRGLFPLALGAALCAVVPIAARAADIAPPMRLVVNSNSDGPIQADRELTLREAIAVTNGVLPLQQLSVEERAQAIVSDPGQPTRIEFDLPLGQTTIYLAELLPPLARPNLILDGTTQPAFAASAADLEVDIETPKVAIAPADGVEVPRGLMVMADGITIQGLSLYGFNAAHRATATAPPADIFISDRLLLQDSPAPEFAVQIPTDLQLDAPPQGVTISGNWLGVAPRAGQSERTSAFGIFAFNSQGVLIESNYIARHNGSAILSGLRAKNLRAIGNTIVENGRAGMPDAIRLEGNIAGSEIVGNSIEGNGGSGVYLFGTEGAVRIEQNRMIQNGRRLERAAVYLVGRDHQVRDNSIAGQPGPGVAIAAYPHSEGNVIRGNCFADLDGLSIDLVARRHGGVQELQVGDGPNLPCDSRNRRRDTANGAIDAPQWLSPEFFSLGGTVVLDGIAEPDSEVDLYLVDNPTGSGYAPLQQQVRTTTAGEDGRFSFELSVPVGSGVSAIATHPRYGTSEPSRVAVVQSLDGVTLSEEDAAEFLAREPHCQKLTNSLSVRGGGP
ncbi:right-handed parallel beta-helix repeat-containing protein [Synechococcus sp. PCC 7336]|uniref:right-handed parallel beta-helix repeat-containing protein n=1 Tax=Synechococcus sp. PCC 7336 TaxID=195250 RepID=UPI00034DAD3F|nr:right-handed parallel beta-helix repeat-containing protein [Synechococcus sp. PCC 7336]